MEKLVYMLWKPEARAPLAFVDDVLAVAGRLDRAGAHQVAVNVVDAAAAQVVAARLTRLDPPPAGMLSCWLDAADERAPIEEALAPVTDRCAGYLVVESVPLRNTTHAAALGARTPGVNMVTCIERPARLAYDAWLAHWHGHHKQVALETQCTFLYIRNVVVRPLTTAAPAWDGIVEEAFPADAVTDPRIWYRADGSEERFRANLQRMLDSVNAFLDVDRVESHPMSQYRISE
jgi:hypothetical protein